MKERKVKQEIFQHGEGSLQLQMQQQMRLFRAQRNFYIVGFTLFLCLVIKKLLELIIANDNIEVSRAGGKVVTLALQCHWRLLICRQIQIKMSEMKMSVLSSGGKYKH